MNIQIVTNYRPLLSKYFAADQALINKWHISAGKGLEACVDKTYEDLEKAKVTFYNVSKGAKLIGYFAKEVFDGNEFLTGFFIIPEFRNPSTKAELWQLIKSNFNSRFFCGLYEKNIPANKFIKSQGGVPLMITTIPDGRAVLYKLGA